jgi:proliferating cell nuclear antigen
MFAAKINTSALQSSMKAMAAVIEESILKIDSEGVSSTAVDPANACMCDMVISEGAFIEFDCTETEIGIDLPRFIEILGMAESGGEINLSIDADTHKLVVDMGKLLYNMSLLDPTSMRKSPSVPELGLPAEIKMHGSNFKRAVKAASMTGDNMTIGIDGNTVYMEANGDSDVVRLDMAEEDLVSLRPADVSATYSIDYLTDIVKGIGNASEITINLGRDLPMVLDFSPYPRCDVTYVLAPRIEPA